MKFLLIVLLATVSASAGYARELVAETSVNGKAALIFNDGFWRYDDDVGEVCTLTGKHGAICAIPSKWSRLPDVDEQRYGLPEFVQGEFLAEFRVLQHWGTGTISMGDLSAYIRNQTTYDGLKGTVLLNSNGKIGDLEGGHVVISAGRKGVFAFTFVDQNGRFLIAQTRDQESSIYHSGHREAHQSFIDAVRPEPFE